MWSNGASFRAIPAPIGTFLSRDNFLRRNIHEKLEKVGLGWVNFQVLRRTQASLGHNQRGHDLGVAMDDYIQSDLESRVEAVTKPEAAFKCEEAKEAEAAASEAA